MQKFLFFDIDYTILEFPHEQGMVELHKYFESKTALTLAYRKRIEAFVDETFYTLLRGETTERSEELRALIEDAAEKVINPTDFKIDLRWSRELWLSVACQQHGVAVKRLKTIIEAAESYWNAFLAHSSIYPDAKKMFTDIKFSAWKVILITNSDARLTDTEKGQLAYDPEYSTRSKLARLPAALLDHSNIKLVIVGDPVGKPHASFWEKVIHDTGYNPLEDIAVMIGDSYASDIVGLREHGIHGVLLDRSGTINRSEAPETTDIIGDLSAVPKLLELLSLQGPTN